MAHAGSCLLPSLFGSYSALWTSYWPIQIHLGGRDGAVWIRVRGKRKFLLWLGLFQASVEQHISSLHVSMCMSSFEIWKTSMRMLCCGFLHIFLLLSSDSNSPEGEQTPPSPPPNLLPSEIIFFYAKAGFVFNTQITFFINKQEPLWR